MASAEPTALARGTDDEAFLTVAVDKLRWDTVPSGWTIEVSSAGVVGFSLASKRGERQMTAEEMTTFKAAKSLELDSFFTHKVWSYPQEVPSERSIAGRFVLTYADGVTSAKARLIVTGNHDPDLLQLETKSPTAMRLSCHFLT